MSTTADSTAFVVALYVLAAATALVLALIERRHVHEHDRRLWPTFWFTTAVLLLLMGAGKAGNVSGLLADLGREQARSGGWYETRRTLQAWVIGAVTAIWACTVAIAVWRVPERRRRYLPPAIAVFTLICFVGIRMISLHQVDSLLQRHDVLHITISTIVEAGLLIAIVVVSAWRLPRSDLERPDRDGGPRVEAGAAGRIQD